MRVARLTLERLAAGQLVRPVRSEEPGLECQMRRRVLSEATGSAKILRRGRWH